jgi:hypothetical protein
MEVPDAQGNWSVKDILAHFVSWDRRGCKWIISASRGRMPQMPEPGLTWSDIDFLNEQTVQTSADKSIQEV